MQRQIFKNRELFGFRKRSVHPFSLPWRNQPFLTPCDSGRQLIIGSLISSTRVTTWYKLDQSDSLLDTQKEGQWSRLIQSLILENLSMHPHQDPQLLWLLLSIDLAIHLTLAPRRNPSILLMTHFFFLELARVVIFAWTKEPYLV